MFFHDFARVFFVLGATDMRKGINGLSMLAASYKGVNVLDGSLFVFCSKNRKMIKALYWERNGFSLYQKKLENDVFLWPVSTKHIFKMSLKELRWLLDGLDPVSLHGYRKIMYTSIT